MNVIEKAINEHHKIDHAYQCVVKKLEYANKVLARIAKTHPKLVERAENIERRRIFERHMAGEQE